MDIENQCQIVEEPVEPIVRFEQDLEFIQSLTNPSYIEFLIDKGFFDDPKFCNYLEYLKYFKQTCYIKYLRYPICLKMLDMIQEPDFIKYFKGPDKNLVVNNLESQLYGHWQYLGDGEIKEPERDNASLNGEGSGQSS